eukprot:NODE_2285_length_373_cov_27.617886_g2275_i0.p2 GENE.NODE_2285_length_373_cov_27.617886_g2275_i0~~NODE_2285_length_373_cov_27.617886_g2275_i0.p2  ORF type:complete len:56 (+),score=7.30 NODE_2285_length_373_cov_27.617886_g2275_i0:94-261(+)
MKVVAPTQMCKSNNTFTESRLCVNERIVLTRSVVVKFYHLSSQSPHPPHRHFSMV